jgi:hypothetical protein
MLIESTRLSYLKILLRIGGVLTGSAFFAMVMPTEWMASTHERLGLGEFSRAPVVEYLARSVAALYGFHGILLFVVARDPVRLRPIVVYLGCFNMVFGALLIAIGLEAGLPSWWIAGEGPSIIVVGLLILLLRPNHSS